jgi:septal ring factor EnvC (AmiA/AmiB activator)
VNGRENSRGATRGRRSRAAIGTETIVDQISKIVAANEALQQENRELAAQNERLQTQLREIGNALARLTGTGTRRRGRPPLTLAQVHNERPPRQRKPITDPEVLEKKRQALAHAREVRAARLAASRAEGQGG